MLMRQLFYSSIVSYKTQHGFLTQFSNDLPQVTIILLSIFADICYLEVTYSSDLLNYTCTNICIKIPAAERYGSPLAVANLTTTDE